MSAEYSFILVGYHSDPHHLKEALALLEHSLRMILVRYSPSDIIVFTDLNAERESGAGKKFFSHLSPTQWKILEPKEPTRIGYGNQRNTVIDFFFVNTSIASATEQVKLEVTSFPFPSDHKPLLLSITSTERSRKCRVTKTSSQQIDIKALKRNAQQLTQLLTGMVHSPEAVQKMFADMAVQGIPLKSRNNNFWAKYVFSLEKRNPSWSTAATVQLLREDYQEFLHSAFDELSIGKCSEFYRKIKAATLRNTNSSFLDINNAYLKSKYASQFFGQLITKKQDVLLEIKAWLLNHFGSVRSPRPITGNLITLTEGEVFAVIKGFWGGKAVSADAIQDLTLSYPLVAQQVDSEFQARGLVNDSVIKAVKAQRVEECQHIMSVNLMQVLNSWLEQKQIPLEHTTSRLILIAKKPIDSQNGNLIDDFRPLAVTSVLFKLLEVLVHRRIKGLLDAKTVHRLHPVQCGFQPHAGCEINILKLMIEAKKAYADWQANRIRGRPCIVFFDFKSAFDSCDHYLLFRDKLSRARFPIEVTNTIQLLYENARTTPSFSFDDAIPIKRGVLQCGVLSPELFNRYINDLAELLVREKFNTFYYADDLAVLAHGDYQVLHIVKIIETWCARNYMALNKSKCGIMSLAGRSTISEQEHKKGNLAGIPYVASYKYLGVYLNRTLQPIKQHEYLQEKLNKFQRMSFILRAHQAPAHVSQMLWKVFQYTTLSYASFLFLPTFSTASGLQLYRNLHRRTLKYALSIPKNTWDVNVQRHVLIPTVEQGLYITLARVCQAAQNHFGALLCNSTKVCLDELQALAQSELGLAQPFDTRQPSWPVLGATYARPLTLLSSSQSLGPLWKETRGFPAQGSRSHVLVFTKNNHVHYAVSSLKGFPTSLLASKRLQT